MVCDNIDNYFFDTYNEENTENDVYVLIIYDIIDNKKRLRLAKHLQSYGFRIQKSAFEAMLSERLYKKLVEELRRYADSEDSIRIYRIIGKGHVTVYGAQQTVDASDVMIL